METLKDLLFLYNVHPKYVGYNYFLRAIELVAEEPNRLQHLNRDIYQNIALEYQKNTRSIEKNIRTVRDIFMKNGGAALLEQIGGGTYWYTDIPPVGDLISIFAHYYRKLLDS